LRITSIFDFVNVEGKVLCLHYISKVFNDSYKTSLVSENIAALSANSIMSSVISSLLFYSSVSIPYRNNENRRVDVISPCTRPIELSNTLDTVLLSVCYN